MRKKKDFYFFFRTSSWFGAGAFLDLKASIYVSVLSLRLRAYFCLCSAPSHLPPSKFGTDNPLSSFKKTRGLVSKGDSGREQELRTAMGFVSLSFNAHSGLSHRDVVPMVTYQHRHRDFAACQLSYFFLISYNTAVIWRNATRLDFNMAFYFS